MIETLTLAAQTAAAFIGILTVIVFIHEFGHYLVARLCGVRIVTFSIGFGRELFGFNDRHGTRWKFSLLPLGGYVKMFGDTSEASTPDRAGLEAMTEEERRISFHYQPLPKKAAIVAAGPVFNFLLTIGIFTWFIFTQGFDTTEPIVGGVLPGSAAEAAGFREGDRFLEIDGRGVRRFGDIPGMIATNMGNAVRITFDRAGERREVDVAPRMVEADDGLGNKMRHPVLGIKSLRLDYKDIGLPRALWESVKKTYDLTMLTFDYLGQVIRGDRSPDELKGPIGIAKMSGQAAEKGMFTILWFMALLSANLGLVNLFPIPPLDGGHLIYYMVEGARGRPLAERFQEYGYRAGFALILMLMAFTIYNDIRQF